MSSTMSRRALLRGAAGLFGVLSVSSLLAACGSTTPAAAPAATAKPAEAAKPAAPAAAPAATTAPAPTTAAAAPAAVAVTAAPVVSRKLSGTVRLHLRTGSEEDTMNAMLPAFKEATGVDVKVETFPTNEYFTKLNTLIAGGNAGDVFWGGYRTTPRLAQNKVIMPLDDLVAKDKYDLNLYWPGVVESCRYQGALVALPFKIHPGPAAVYYNVQVMQEAGVKMPDKAFASWDELLKAAHATTKDGRWGFQINITPGGAINTPQPVLQYLRSWGAELISEDGKKSLLNEQKAKDAIKFMYDLMWTEKVAVTGKDLSDPSEDLMVAQKVAMLQAASSTKSITTKIGGKFEVRNAIMPPGPGGVVGTQAIPDHITLNAKTQNADAAWELAKFMTSTEFGVRLGGGQGGASGTTGAQIAVFNDPRIMANPLHPIFIDLVKASKAVHFPANLREEEHATALHQTLMTIWLGERKPDDAFFDELTKACQAVLDQPIA
jgi:multiple sugar transport system substrate-binding protein